MNLGEDFFNIRTENEESNVTMVNRDCEGFSFSCTSFSGPVDTSTMSEDVFDLFMFNREVLYLTENLWKELLQISNLEGVLSEKDLCYSIIDAANCNTLNKYFLSLNYNLPSFQRTDIDSNNRKHYTDLLGDTLNALGKFLKSTLPHLMKNVEHLIFKIERSNGEKITKSSHKTGNFGNEANNAIHKYLKQLNKAVMNFKIKNVPEEILDKKMSIEAEINESYMNKSFFLGIPINEEDNQNYDDFYNIGEFYDNDTTTDFYDNLLLNEGSGVPDDLEITLNHIEGEGFETTENFETTTELIMPVSNNALVQDFESNNKDLVDLSSPRNLEAEGFINSSNIIIIGSIFTFVGLFAVIIVFYYLKFTRKREKRIKELKEEQVEVEMKEKEQPLV